MKSDVSDLRMHHSLEYTCMYVQWMFSWHCTTPPGTLRDGGWISPALLATIRILQATEEEFAVVGTGEAAEGGRVRSTYAGGVVSPRNEMATYISLRELLYAKLRPESAQVSVCL
jgi:hypothetical protein